MSICRQLNGIRMPDYDVYAADQRVGCVYLSTQPQVPTLVSELVARQLDQLARAGSAVR
jgi:hypothetical protein